MNVEALKCPACGAIVTGEGDFCNYCGAKLLFPETKKSSAHPDEKVLTLLKEGNFLEAVKVYKDASGKGLKESKDHVDALAKQHGIERKGGCFVATACYGDYDAPEVVVLRRYRDARLATTAAGRTFVRFYYTVSPPLAKFLERMPLFKALVRSVVLAPIIKRLDGKFRN
jgi:hypothetical protein